MKYLRFYRNQKKLQKFEFEFWISHLHFHKKRGSLLKRISFQYWPLGTHWENQHWVCFDFHVKNWVALNWFFRLNWVCFVFPRQKNELREWIIFARILAIFENIRSFALLLNKNKSKQEFANLELKSKIYGESMSLRSTRFRSGNWPREPSLKGILCDNCQPPSTPNIDPPRKIETNREGYRIPNTVKNWGQNLLEDFPAKKGDLLANTIMKPRIKSGKFYTLYFVWLLINEFWSSNGAL